MARRKATPEDWLPLTQPALQVLLSLADGEKHGYAILKEIARRTEAAVAMSVSTLYGVLQRLERDALIREAATRPDPDLDDERRRYFRITDLGRDVLRAELARFERAIAMAAAKRLRPAST